MELSIYSVLVCFVLRACLFLMLLTPCLTSYRKSSVIIEFDMVVNVSSNAEGNAAAANVTNYAKKDIQWKSFKLKEDSFKLLAIKGEFYQHEMTNC